MKLKILFIKIQDGSINLLKYMLKKQLLFSVTSDKLIQLQIIKYQQGEMKNIIYEIMVNVQQKFTGPVLRSLGQRLYAVGTKIQGESVSEDRMVPSLRNLSLENVRPQLQQTDFVAPNATVIGNVTAGEKSSIWYGAILLGNEGINIGNNSVIQDRVHISRNVSIGNHVFVGPNTILQGATLQNRAFVAMGATVRHATIQKGGFVAAGAVVEDNAIVKEGEVWAGNPAKYLRSMTPLERQVIYEHLEQMQELACIHSEEAEKSQRDLLNGPMYRNRLGMQEFAEHFVQSHNFTYSETDEQFVEQRIFMKHKLEYPEIAKDYEPFIYDMSSFSDKFNVGVHDEEVKRVATKIKQKEEFVNSREPWNAPY